MPGEQKPHWIAPASTKARWAGWSVPSTPPSPSMVVTSRPSSRAAGSRQELTASPSTRMVQAPHSPSPQPILVPVSSSLSRSSSAAGSKGRAWTLTRSPLTVKVIIMFMGGPGGVQWTRVLAVGGRVPCDGRVSCGLGRAARRFEGRRDGCARSRLASSRSRHDASCGLPPAGIVDLRRRSRQSSLRNRATAGLQEVVAHRALFRGYVLRVQDTPAGRDT